MRNRLKLDWLYANYIFLQSLNFSIYYYFCEISVIDSAIRRFCILKNLLCLLLIKGLAEGTNDFF